MHEWRIEPREYARQEARRGRRHAFERLDPVRTATVHTIYRSFGDVRPTAEVLALIAAGR